MQFHLVSHHGQLCKSTLEQALLVPVLPGQPLEQEPPGQPLEQEPPGQPLEQGLLEPPHHAGCRFPKQIFQLAQTSPRPQLVR
jgi:hypothetical protein